MRSAIPYTLGALAAITLLQDRAPQSRPTYAVFAPLDGTWRGEFCVRKPDGTLVTRLRVTQVYTRQSDTRQTCVMDNVVDGKTTRETAENLITPAGELLCKVRKADGSEVVHHGRAEGDQLFWSGTRAASEPGGLRLESFRERVEGDRYLIDGFGIYGDPLTGTCLFHGEYRRVRER